MDKSVAGTAVLERVLEIITSTGSTLWPDLVKAQVVDWYTDVMSLVFLALVSLLMLMYARVAEAKDWYSDPTPEVIRFISAAAAVIAVVGMAICIANYDMVLAPEAAALDSLLHSLSGHQK